MTELLPCQRALFDIPRGVVYLNCAYMSPLLTASVQAGLDGVARKARPWTIRAPDFFELPNLLRERFARLIGCAADDVALIPAVSYGMATAAANLPVERGQTVLLLDEEFPSVIYPWRERARAAGAEAVLLPRPPDDDWTAVVLDAIDDDVAVAALPPCHWTDGAVLDLERIGARLREVGAALVVDATQWLGAAPFDIGRIRPDVVVAAAYKWLLGPYSVGFMYVAPRWQKGRPVEQTWIAREGSEDFAGLVNYRDAFQAGARRYDVGEPSNFALLPVAAAALRQILEWDVARIAATLRGHTAALAGHGEALGLAAAAPALRAPHYLGLRHPEGLPPGLGDRLAANGVYVSTRGSALRVTPHLYNDAEDLARFGTALAAALATG